MDSSGSWVGQEDAGIPKFTSCDVLGDERKGVKMGQIIKAA